LTDLRQADQVQVAVSHRGVKRWLRTPFALCGQPEDLRRIGEEIVKQAEMLSSSGWVRVDLSNPDDSPPNKPPLEWDDDALNGKNYRMRTGFALDAYIAEHHPEIAPRCRGETDEQLRARML